MSCRFSCAVVLAALLCACGQSKSDPRFTPTKGLPKPHGEGGSGGMGAAGAPTEQQPPRDDCKAPAPGPAPAPRLEREQLWLSLRSVLREALPDEPATTSALGEYGDDTNAEVSAQDAQNLHALAHELAERVSKSATARRALADCDEVASSDSCREQFLGKFPKLAYRRQVTNEDLEEMRAVFATGKELGGDFASGMRAVLEVAFQTPDFGYVLELGAGEAEGDVVRLTGFETAARLAYFLTNAPPDDALMAAAEAGPLSAEQVEAQARRLLGGPENRARVLRFYQQTYRLGTGNDDPALSYTASVRGFAAQETAHFIDDVTFDGAGTFRALLTEPSTWVNDELAAFYGYAGGGGPTFRKLALDPKQRSGLFTQISFLRATSPSSRSNPVRRGLGVLESLLCYVPPSPPADLKVSLPDVPAGSTTRERLTAVTSSQECRSCHQDIDPIGFAFEHYDAVARWRDSEDGTPIDASGDLQFGDVSGSFNGAPELLARIADSEDAQNCYVGHWLASAYERATGQADVCARLEVSKAFSESDGKVTDLLVAIAKTDNLRFRLKNELVP